MVHYRDKGKGRGMRGGGEGEGQKWQGEVGGAPRGRDRVKYALEGHEKEREREIHSDRQIDRDRLIDR